MSHGQTPAAAARPSRLRRRRSAPVPTPRHAAHQAPASVPGVAVAPAAWSVLPGSPPVPTVLPVAPVEAPSPVEALADQPLGVPQVHAALPLGGEALPAAVALPQPREPLSSTAKACLTILPR